MVLSLVPTTTLVMAHTDIEDTITTATGIVATSNLNFIQPAPGAPTICAGRGGVGAQGGDVTVVGDILPACQTRGLLNF